MQLRLVKDRIGLILLFPQFHPQIFQLSKKKIGSSHGGSNFWGEEELLSIPVGRKYNAEVCLTLFIV